MAPDIDEIDESLPNVIFIPEQPMIPIGPACKRVREHLGWGVRQAAKVIGISHAHVINIESGEAEPSLKLLGQMGGAYRYDLIGTAWLMQNGRTLPTFPRAPRKTPPIPTDTPATPAERLMHECRLNPDGTFWDDLRDVLADHTELREALKRAMAGLRAVLQEVSNGKNNGPEKDSCVSVPYVYEVAGKALAETVALAPPT